MKTVSELFAYLQTKKIAFIGTGVTNDGIIRLFRSKGYDVTILDKKSAEDMGESYTEFSNLGVKFINGAEYLDSLNQFDIVFRAPGMYFGNEKLQKARKEGVVITTEMEIFFEFCPCKIYAVTGSDGKTTSTTLISEFLQKAGKKVYKGGNIGKALLPLIEEIRPEDVAVVELSSFQLFSMRQSPNVALITNISPNHLDVHGTMDEYIYCKKQLLLHQDAFSKAVLNLDNEPTAALQTLVRGKLSMFSRKQMVEDGAFLREDGMLCYHEGDQIIEVIHKDEIRIPGIHNVENYLGAISAVWGEVTIPQICEVARTFGGVEHRIEFVREIDGVKFYNDSIASSPTRVLAGLNAFSQKLIVIAGGYDKKIPYEPLGPTVCEKVKILILMGATADKIEAAVKGSANYVEDAPKIVRVSSMEEAVNTAKSLAVSGDVVTLSPASASFDMYKNFEVRGQHYKRLVNEL